MSQQFPRGLRAFLLLVIAFEGLFHDLQVQIRHGNAAVQWSKLLFDFLEVIGYEQSYVKADCKVFDLNRALLLLPALLLLQVLQLVESLYFSHFFYTISLMFSNLVRNPSSFPTTSTILFSIFDILSRVTASKSLPTKLELLELKEVVDEQLRVELFFLVS